MCRRPRFILRPSRIACATLSAALTTACAPPTPTEVAAPAAFPAAWYRQAEAQGRRVLEIDPRQSLVTVAVGKAGSHAHLGHEHLVASRDVKGLVAPEDGRADLYVPLHRLSVDEDELLAAAGKEKNLSEAAVEGTRRNMLDKVLEADRFPHALIHVARTEGDGEALQVAVTLHDTTRRYTVRARTEAIPGGLAVSGKLQINQSDFGITPLSILGGAVQVRDRLDLGFRIVARGG